MPLDAVIVGSGPNGLSAAITLARAGLRVQVLEAHAKVGGGLSSDRTPDGFVFDNGSAIHPLAYASPAWQEWPLHAFGLDWRRSPAPFAHVWQDGRALALPQRLDEAAQALGADGGRWRALFGPLVAGQQELFAEILRPVLRLPRHPLILARFGVPALLPAPLSGQYFRTAEARALWAGLAAHANVSPHSLGASAAGVLLGTAAHAGGWPFPRGGAQALADALAEYLRFLGGDIRLNAPVQSRADLPPARAVLVDSGLSTLQGLLRRSTPGYDGWLSRFRYGLGALKVDYALSGPVPWQDETAFQAATLHIGGTGPQVTAAEAGAEAGHLARRPYLLAAQPSLFDPSRAPAGGQTFWVYAHVPAGTGPEYAGTVEDALEQLAPGFRARILRRRVTVPQGLQAFSPVFVGGDVNGGRFDLPGLVARPTPAPTPYRTPDPQVYLCSAAAAPGGGVHGMSGYHAARAVLQDLF